MSNPIISKPQQQYGHTGYSLSYGFRDTPYNYQPGRVPHTMQSRFGVRSLLKRNSEFYLRNPDDERRTQGSQNTQKRSDNGSFKILNTRSTSREQPDLVFPDQSYDIVRQVAPDLGDSSPCGEAVCEHVSNYPADLIGSLLNKIGTNISEYFSRDDSHIEVGERFNAPGEESLCESYTNIVRPQSAENKVGNWLFVVNHDNYSQEIQMEVCNGTEEKCKFTSNFPNGYETYCKQKYVYRKLYALEKDSKRVVLDTFKLPSCCSCVVKYVGDISNRSAFPMSKVSNFNKKPALSGRMTRQVKH